MRARFGAQSEFRKPPVYWRWLQVSYVVYRLQAARCEAFFRCILTSTVDTLEVLELSQEVVLSLPKTSISNMFPLFASDMVEIPGSA